MPDMKEIDYRRGLLRFAIPTHWVVDHDSQGGGVFYADEPGSGTLRVSVQALAGKRQVDEPALLSVLGRYGTVERLPDGKAVVRYSREASEDGIPITILCWEVVGVIPPQQVGVAMFSYTIESIGAESPRVQTEVRMIDKSICASEFAPNAASSRLAATLDGDELLADGPPMLPR